MKKEQCGVRWRLGDCNLVVSVPHAGVLGQDTGPAGNLLCENGNVIETRKGSLQYPIKTYARDAQTDVIAKHMRAQLAEEGLLPHIIECHVHRSKVECNRNMVEIAVATLGKEAETIHKVYHSWISQALQAGVQDGGGQGALLLDLHGHGHPHDCIELGYRLSAELLNQINNEEVQKRTWRSIVTSSARHEFTLRHLLSRQYGTSEEGIREAVIGEHSFGGCLSKALAQRPIVADGVCLPSEAKPCPGRLGYYTGGHTVREHSKGRKVDSLQVELPLSMRTQGVDRMEAAARALADAMAHFHRLHYSAKPTHLPAPQAANDPTEEQLSESDEEGVGPSLGAAPPPPPPGPPPPPPPPMVAAPAAVCEDGIGHNTRMSKSKMHAELIRKAKSRMVEEESTQNVHLDEEEYGPAPPSPVISKATQPAPPPTSSPPPPPPPPPLPPPPPPPAVSAQCRPDTSDGIAHSTAMSKADMHKELIAKSKFKDSEATVVEKEGEKKEEVEKKEEENNAERKARERKKLVQDILKKEDEACCPASSSRQANEKARRDFFADKDELEKEEEKKRESYAEEAKEEEEEEMVEANKEEKTPSPPLNSQDKKSCNIL